MFKNLFKTKATDFIAPMSGTIINIEDVNDPVFAEKMMGDGFAIQFESGDVYSPIDGEVISIFPTKHAIGIRDLEGNEYLLHIGLDTVLHKGHGFESLVEAGDSIQKGDLLVKVDHNYFKESGVDLTSPIILTNLSPRGFKMLKSGAVTVGDKDLIKIK